MNDDLISRQAVINLIRRCNSALEEPRIFNSHNSGNLFECYITELPSVNPQEIIRDCTSCRWSKDGCCAGTEECHLCMWESQYKPKTGHWKPYLKEGLRYQCSACDSRFDTPWEYCPHCGAKMVEPQESEEV